MEPSKSKIEIQVDGKSASAEAAGLDFGGGSLIPANAVVDKPITVKSTHVGTKFTGSVDDLLRQLGKK